jgi:hypothetical protein
MISAQELEFVNTTPPAAIIDNAAAGTTTIDTFGCGAVLIVVQLGALDIAVGALKVQESDDSGMSGAADITETVFGGTGNPALPAATADNNLYGFLIHCNGHRKRYLDLVATLGDGSAGTYISALTIKFRHGTLPSTATGRGFAAEVIV